MESTKEIYVEFAIIFFNILLSYNIILGRLILNNYEIAINIEFLYLIPPAVKGIASVKSNKKFTQECYRQLTNVVAQMSLLIDLLEKSKEILSSQLLDDVKVIKLREGKNIMFSLAIEETIKKL